MYFCQQKKLSYLIALTMFIIIKSFGESPLLMNATQMIGCATSRPNSNSTVTSMFKFLKHLHHH